MDGEVVVASSHNLYCTGCICCFFTGFPPPHQPFLFYWIGHDERAVAFGVPKDFPS